MDQQNVYMSNSTAATATGTSMIASGHAISKEKLAEETVDKTEDLKQDEHFINVEEPFESTAVEGAKEEVDIPFASDSQEQVSSSQLEEEETPVEENLEDIPFNDAEEEKQVEYQEDFAQSPILDDEPADEEESVATTEQEENQAEAPAVNAAVGGDELSISFDVTPQAAPAEANEDLIEETESSDEKEELTTSEESAASDYAVEIKVSEEETSSAPLPMPGRRPPRRHSRFQNTTRSNHSLRHLRRF